MLLLVPFEYNLVNNLSRKGSLKDAGWWKFLFSVLFASKVSKYGFSISLQRLTAAWIINQFVQIRYTKEASSNGLRICRIQIAKLFCWRCHQKLVHYIRMKHMGFILVVSTVAYKNIAFQKIYSKLGFL